MRMGAAVATSTRRATPSVAGAFTFVTLRDKASCTQVCGTTEATNSTKNKAESRRALIASAGEDGTEREGGSKQPTATRYGAGGPVVTGRCAHILCAASGAVSPNRNKAHWHLPAPAACCVASAVPPLRGSLAGHRATHRLCTGGKITWRKKTRLL